MGFFDTVKRGFGLGGGDSAPARPKSRTHMKGYTYSPGEPDSGQVRKNLVGMRKSINAMPQGAERKAVRTLRAGYRQNLGLRVRNKGLRNQLRAR